MVFPIVIYTVLLLGMIVLLEANHPSQAYSGASIVITCLLILLARRYFLLY